MLTGILNGKPFLDRHGVEGSVGRDERQRVEAHDGPPPLDVQGGGQLHGIVAAQGMRFGQVHGILYDGACDRNDVVQADELLPEGRGGSRGVLGRERPGSLLPHQRGHCLSPGDQGDVDFVAGVRMSMMPNPVGPGFPDVPLDERTTVEKEDAHLSPVFDDDSGGRLASHEHGLKVARRRRGRRTPPCEQAPVHHAFGKGIFGHAGTGVGEEGAQLRTFSRRERTCGFKDLI